MRSTILPISLRKKSRMLLKICVPTGKFSRITDPTIGTSRAAIVVANMSFKNINQARSWDIPPKRKSFRAVKCLCRIPIGISRRRDMAFPMARKAPTRSGSLRVIVKKYTTVKWKSIHTNPMNTFVLSIFLIRISSSGCVARTIENPCSRFCSTISSGCVGFMTTFGLFSWVGWVVSIEEKYNFLYASIFL